MIIPAQSSSVADEIYQLDDVVDLPALKTNLLADIPVVDESKDDQQARVELSPMSEHASLDTALSKKTTPPKTVNLSLAQDVMVNHLDIDRDEFKIAVNLPRLGVDRILDSAMLHGKLNNLLERGLIPHGAARTAFRQAQQNRIDR